MWNPQLDGLCCALPADGKPVPSRRVISRQNVTFRQSAVADTVSVTLCVETALSEPARSRPGLRNPERMQTAA
jgi:hypothetical protein